MPRTEYVLCKFKTRWWPAKVLSRSRASGGRLTSADKAASVRVEIMCLNKQANVRWADVRPLTEESIQEIASMLDQNKRRCSPTKELIYRRALREALDILHCAVTSTAGTPSKRRTEEPQNQKDWSLGTPRRLLSSCKDPPKAGGGASPDPVPHGEESPSANRARASPGCKASVVQTRGLSGGGQSPGELHGVSEATTEMKSHPRPGSEGRRRRSSKEETKQGPVKGGSGRKRCPPSPALQPPTQTCTPVLSSRRSSSRLASTGRKLAADPGQRKGLSGSPPAHPPEVSSFPDEGASPVGKGAPVRNGNWYPKGSKGAREDQHSVEGSSPSRKRRHRLCLENLNLQPGPEKSSSEHEREEETGRPAEERQVEASEEKDGWESPCDLSLSPIGGGCSLSPAFREEEEEEEEELPSLLPFQEPGLIEAGKLVWCKLQRYPYWPAVVRKVKRKARKASVFFIEKSMEEKTKGFSISLKKLKPFDCQEKQKLIKEAREDYNDEINWCINLIEDYRIRVGCCSFRGSFLEYCVDAMSYPVRKEAPHGLSQMNFPQGEDEGDSRGSPSETPPAKLAKKVLPDRMRASRDRANGKIVDFIVKAKGADKHLCSVLKSERPSRWLAQFLHASPYLTSIETYLEDDSQQDLVFHYLQEVYQELDTSALPLVNGDRVRFILDVLFPEAIICAISAIERIDYKKAEEKYIRGPLVSQREREIFEEEILEQKRKQQTEKASPEDRV